MQLQTTVSQT